MDPDAQVGNGSNPLRRATIVERELANSAMLLDLCVRALRDSGRGALASQCETQSARAREALALEA